MPVTANGNGSEYTFDPTRKLVTVRPIGTPDYETSFYTIVKIATTLEFGPQYGVHP